MSENSSEAQTPFVVTPQAGGGRLRDAEPMAGGTALTPGIAGMMRARGVANPDDPAVPQSVHRERGIPTEPEESGLPGRIAIVQGQIYIVGVILVAQLLLVTTALYELLSNRRELLWWIAGASLAGFIIALVVALAPRRRVLGG